MTLLEDFITALTRHADSVVSEKLGLPLESVATLRLQLVPQGAAIVKTRLEPFFSEEEKQADKPWLDHWIEAGNFNSKIRPASAIGSFPSRARRSRSDSPRTNGIT